MTSSLPTTIYCLSLYKEEWGQTVEGLSTERAESTLSLWALSAPFSDAL